MPKYLKVGNDHGGSETEGPGTNVSVPPNVSLAPCRDSQTPTDVFKKASSKPDLQEKSVPVSATFLAF